MTILWTEPSLNDLKAIRDYIAKDSETYAAGFIESLLSAVEQLREFPRLGRVVPEAHVPDIRELNLSRLPHHVSRGSDRY
jgi:toxin ParE1/3/4